MSSVSGATEGARLGSKLLSFVYFLCVPPLLLQLCEVRVVDSLLHHMHSGNRTQSLSLGGKCLHPPRHLSASKGFMPLLFYIYLCIYVFEVHVLFCFCWILKIALFGKCVAYKSQLQTIQTSAVMT